MAPQSKSNIVITDEPVIPGMVFIIHWFDHRMNLHKNKAWWIHYPMIPVVMITALILIIGWDETGRDGNTLLCQHHPIRGQYCRPWPIRPGHHSLQVSGDRLLIMTGCVQCLRRDPPCSHQTLIDLFIIMLIMFPVYWRYQRHQTRAAMIPMIIIPGLSWSCGGSPADTSTTQAPAYIIGKDTDLYSSYARRAKLQLCPHFSNIFHV